MVHVNIIKIVLFLLSLYLLSRMLIPSIQTILIPTLLLIIFLLLLSDLLLFFQKSKIIYGSILGVKIILLIGVFFISNYHPLSSKPIYITKIDRLYLYREDRIPDPGSFLLIYEKGKGINPLLTFKLEKRAFFVNENYQVDIHRVDKENYSISVGDRNYLLNINNWNMTRK